MLARLLDGEPGPRREAVLLERGAWRSSSKGGRGQSRRRVRARACGDRRAARRPVAFERMQGGLAARHERRPGPRSSRTSDAPRARGISRRIGAGAAPDATAPRFVASLREPGARIIAEIKARSPSAGEILPEPGRKGRDLRARITGAATRRRSRSSPRRTTSAASPEWLPAHRAISGLPVLMKDFIVAERQLDFAAVARRRRGAADRARAPGRRTLARLRARRPGARASRSSSRRTTRSRSASAAAVAPDVLGVNARDLDDLRDGPRRARGDGAGDPARARAPGRERHPDAAPTSSGSRRRASRRSSSARRCCGPRTRRTSCGSCAA